jgi:hypothetical protein
MKTRLSFTLLVCLAHSLFADNYQPLSSTNAIVLNFDSRIQQEAKRLMRDDFMYGLTLQMEVVKLHHRDRNPTNCYRLANFGQPYWFAATSRLGPKFPTYGTISNGTFTIDISYAFATNYQRHIESTSAFSNEIAAAYAFIESLTPTNLAVMSTYELQSLDLWKEVPPGRFPASVGDEASIAYCRKRRVYAPPRFAFFVWDCGPTNNPPYLWCHVPAVDKIGQRTIVTFDMMIYFQNKWWFSAWPFLEGEQQW